MSLIYRCYRFTSERFDRSQHPRPVTTAGGWRPRGGAPNIEMSPARTVRLAWYSFLVLPGTGLLNYGSVVHFSYEMSAYLKSHLVIFLFYLLLWLYLIAVCSLVQSQNLLVRKERTSFLTRKIRHTYEQIILGQLHLTLTLRAPDGRDYKQSQVVDNDS